MAIGGILSLSDMDPTILLVALTSMLVGAVLAWLLRPGSSVASMAMSELDAGPELEGLVTTRCARLLAYEFKAQFGELRYNNANRIVAGDWVRARMAQMDMRHVDIDRHAHVAIELCLLPTSRAVFAAQLAKSGEFRDRRAAVSAPK